MLGLLVMYSVDMVNGVWLQVDKVVVVQSMQGTVQYSMNEHIKGNECVVALMATLIR